MTNSVSKNLHVEESVAATLNSTHIPFHLLCVSHTCEVFDRGNMAILKNAEEKLGLREKLIARMPALKSFLSAGKSVTVTALEALNKLVSNDGHVSSQWELFEKLLLDKKKTKKQSQYRERRFAKLGYVASTILHHIDDYEDLLKDTKSNNQLVQACRVYLECDFVIIGLKVLSWFTYKVTLPFLNMVELSSQKELLSILPTLYDDLSAASLETLSDYKVNYSFEPPEPLSAVEKHILDLCSRKAAQDLATQRGREYGFGPEADSSSRATAIHKLDPAVLPYLPTDNLDCERDLAVFDKLAQRSASCSNKTFTAKGIRDEMTVHKCPPVFVNKITKSLSKILDQQEKEWMEKQKVLSREKLEKNCRAALKAVEYVHILLKKCKAWGGPFTNMHELEDCVLSTTDDDALKAILRTEIAYRKHTSPHDVKTRPQLYRLNQVTTSQFKVNLTFILSTESDLNSEAIPDMPTEQDMERIFLNSQTTSAASTAAVSDAVVNADVDDPEVLVNEPCIVVWDTSLGRQWFVGICISDDGDDTYTVEHLERCNPNQSKLWKYPSNPDIHTVNTVQIIPCNIIGSWDMTRRVMTFNLENWEMIAVLFRSFY